MTQHGLSVAYDVFVIDGRAYVRDMVYAWKSEKKNEECGVKVGQVQRRHELGKSQRGRSAIRHMGSTGHHCVGCV